MDPPRCQGQAPSQAWQGSVGLRVPTWTWSSRRRCWKSWGSVVRVTGPTSARHGQHHLSPLTPAPASPNATHTARAPGTCPGSNACDTQGTASTLAWHQERSGLGQTSPCAHTVTTSANHSHAQEFLPTLWVVPARVSCKLSALFYWGRLPAKQCRNQFTASASFPVWLQWFSLS